MLAGALIAVSLTGMNNAASAQEAGSAYNNAFFGQQAQDVWASGADGLQKADTGQGKKCGKGSGLKKTDGNVEQVQQRMGNLHNRSSLNDASLISPAGEDKGGCNIGCAEKRCVYVDKGAGKAQTCQKCL